MTATSRWGGAGLSWLLIGLAVLAGGSSFGSPAAVRAEGAVPCPLPQGYWKSAAAWPAETLVLGDAGKGAHRYTRSELQKLLGMPVRGDASVILAQQLIAAKLNVANGSHGGPIAATVAAADALLSPFPGKLPYQVSPAAAPGRAMVAAAGILDDYNNGRLGDRCGAPNTAPVAHAGPDQTVVVGTEVTLDGSGSTDVDGDPLTFRWRMVERPAGSGASLSEVTAVRPTFVVDRAGTYVVELVVNDGRVDSAPDTVEISTENSAPVAHAGPDQTVPVGAMVVLDGSGSSDVDGDILTYAWALVEVPAESRATLDDPAAVGPTFVVDLPGRYRARLLVHDGTVPSQPAYVEIDTRNSAPVADAGPDQRVLVGTTVTLDGRGSSDVDGDTLTYHWALTVRPDGSAAELDDATAEQPTFEADVAGIYVAQLIVDDGLEESLPDTVTVTADPVVGPVNQAPQVSAGPDLEVTLPAAATLTGSVVDDGRPAGGVLTIEWSKVSGLGTVTFANGNSPVTTATFSAPGDYVLELRADDGELAASDQVAVRVNPAPDGSVPPDPATVAPPVDGTVATTVASGTAFLYTGPNPIQTGVAPETIDPVRAAVVRGRVVDRGGVALSGVTVTVLRHPEFGQTLSRADGMFDLAVNGGGVLTVNYEKSGFLPVQRQVLVPWQGWAITPDVIMIPVDTRVTTVTANASEVQVHRGSVASDADGSRQATILFPAGTTATLVMPDGSAQPLPAFNVRATEYTIGADGARMMPGELPPTSGYTYAVEFSVDEALAAGASMVSFNQPVPTYVENFIGFPVGTIVPAGYYDKTQGKWIAAPNGKVIGIVGITGGFADIDVTGDGVADDPGTVLAVLGITPAERQSLAGLYAPGQSLWRVPVAHFTPWDYNWPYGPPDDAQAPATAGATTDGDVPDCPSQSAGSIIECESQVLGQSVPLVGTPHALTYRSDRAPGRGQRVIVRLSGASVPASLLGIRLRASVAGQIHDMSFPPAPNQTHVIEWDGRDAYGRPAQGGQLVSGVIEYVYPQVYRTPADFAQSFANVGGGVLFGLNRSSATVSISQPFTTTLGEGLADARPIGLGGWTLSSHHFYDPVSRVLHLGSGGRRRADSVGRVIDRVVDGVSTSDRIDPLVLAGGSDGSIYFVRSGGGALRSTIRRLTPDGVESVVGGGGNAGAPDFGDGGPATAATLLGPFAFAPGPDEAIYFTETAGFSTDRMVIRRVGPDGRITRVAGVRMSDADFDCRLAPDGGLAAETALCTVSSVAVTPDGSIYFHEFPFHAPFFDQPSVLRRIGPDGIVTTIAGGPRCDVFSGLCGDGGPARAARFVATQIGNGVGVAPDGSVYIADTHVIRVIGPDGIIRRVAGTTNIFQQCVFFAPDDGNPAMDARLCNPRAFTFGPDGSVFFADSGFGLIRRIAPDGLLTHVAGKFVDSGGGTRPNTGEGGPALDAVMDGPYSLALAPDGTLYAGVVHSPGHRIRRTGLPLPGLGAASLLLPSADGRELYAFTGTGKHLRTLHALTGETVTEFAYDGAGRLTQVIEKTGGADNVTTIHHDGPGHPTKVVGPYGHETALVVDQHGFLAGITNPAGETVGLVSTATGLLTRFTDPRGGARTYAYDSDGRLVRSTDPAGGTQALARTAGPDFTEVVRTTGLGRSTRYRIEALPNGAERRTVTAADGTQTITEASIDAGRTTVRAPDGTVVEVQFGPDPRFGMQAPIPARVTVTSPGGLAVQATTTRTATLLAPQNPLSLQTLTTQTTIDNQTSTEVYQAASRTMTSTSPAGRPRTTTIDPLGRIVQGQIAGLDPVSYAYDARGRLASITQGDGAAARSAVITYGAAGFIETITDPLGRNVALVHDAAGRLSQAVLPGGRTVTYGYDASGNRTRVTTPAGPEHGFAFNALNQLTVYTPPGLGAASGPIQFEYNADRQSTRVVLPGGEAVVLEYTAVSEKPKQVILPSGAVSIAHDPTTGLVSSLTTPEGNRVSYAHDASRLTLAAWTGAVAGSVARQHDARGRIAGETVNGVFEIAYAYDADGLATAVGDLQITRDPLHGLITGTTLGLVADQRTYDRFGERSSHAVTVGGVGVFTTTSVRDAAGRIIRKSETVEGVTTVLDYAYDAAGRLVEVRADGSAVAAYTYDANGNRLTVTTGAGPVPASYDAQDQILTHGGVTFTHDAIGQWRTRTEGGQTTTYHYDPLGTLKGVTLPGGTVIEYVTDGANRRIGKRVNGALVQSFLYRDALRPAAELDGAGNVVGRFVYAGRALQYLVRAGRTYRVITDDLGSPRLVIDAATGAVAQRMEYDVFGNVIADTNPGFQPFGFAGGLYDRDTKLTRFGFRDYDARTGRWTARDSEVPFTGQDVYSYADNDPVNLVDRFGRPPGDLLDDPTIEQATWEQMQRDLAEAERRMAQLQEAGRNARPGSGRWQTIRRLREQTAELIRSLRQRLNAGGILGQCMALLGVSDLIAITVTAAQEGHSLAEELSIQDEAEREEAAQRGAQTRISCLGPLCLVIDNKVY